MGYLRNILLGLGGLALGLFITVAFPGQAPAERKLAVDPEELVEVEIATVAIASNGNPVVLLREPHDNMVVPIFIGAEQAIAISRALRATEMPRPMTHDLMINIIAGLEAELTRVYVDDLQHNAFFGMLEIAMAGHDEPLRIDSRPSDALAMAVRTGATIHIAPKVMKAAVAIEYQGLEDEVVTAVGITVNLVTEDLQAALQLPAQKGVLVSKVTGPALEAGLKPGALIIKVNDDAPATPMEFLELVRTTEEDEDVAVTYWQDGEEHRIQVPTDVPAPRQFRERGDPGIEL